ncbi:dihydrofolate reductase family protein [Cohnella boryungensis]|uniref:Dihydrofolate reductase family protein n=1 Tax=Cohnella boryungensis TaxID=768479 RepID=A0ABV8SI87_9BACL
MLKEQPAKNLVIFGSPGAGKTLLKLGLIDEFLLTICPIVLGGGKSVFDGGARKSDSSCCPAERSSRALSLPAMSWRNSRAVQGFQL